MDNSSAADYTENNQTLPSVNLCYKSSFGHIFLPVSYSVLFLLSLAGNVSLLFHYLRREKSSSKLFMAHLATLDLFMALTLPLVVDYRLQGSDWRFGQTLCSACLTLFFGNLYGGCLFMLCISVERLIAVRYPLAYGKWIGRQHSRRLICLCVWLIVGVFVLWSAASLRVLNPQPDGSMACRDRYSYKHWDRLPSLLVLVTVTCFFLPYAAILSCYVLITRQLASSRGEGQRWKSKSLRAIITLIAIMTVCFLPFHTVQMVKVVHRFHTGSGKGGSFGFCLSQHTLILMASLNSALDPFVYYFLSSSLKINQLCGWRCK